MKNISTKYKLMALVPLFMLAGCKRQEYKNVIIDKVANEEERVWKLLDVKSGQKRFFVYSKMAINGSYYDYLGIGDTVSVSLNGGRFISEEAYQKGLFFDTYDVEIKYNDDSVKVRQAREYFNSLRNKTIKTR